MIFARFQQWIAKHFGLESAYEYYAAAAIRAAVESIESGREVSASGRPTHQGGLDEWN